MQTITRNHEPTAAFPAMAGFGPALYATDPGIDHPTPPAADPTKTGAKPNPKQIGRAHV